MSIKIYHNPKCSKSRQALAMLHAKGLTPEIVDYINAPLDEEKLRSIAALLGCDKSPRDMMRIKEDEYKSNNLKDADDQTLFTAMSNFPKLIERPIIINGKRAVIARPTEKLLDIL